LSQRPLCVGGVFAGPDFLQNAGAIFHCCRFLEPSYASILAPECQFGANVLGDAGLTEWLSRS
jgi:hypothetical protein